MSNTIGVYGQVGGTSLSVALGSDGLTIGLGGQLSAGYVVSGSTNFNYSISNGWSIQPSVMHGIGTPTGMPGLTYAIQTSVNSPTNQIQVGFGITDVLEAGISFSTTRNTSAVQNSGSWINEFTGLPGYTQTPPTAQSYAITFSDIKGTPLSPLGTPASGISSAARAAISALPTPTALDQAKAQQAAQAAQAAHDLAANDSQYRRHA